MAGNTPDKTDKTMLRNFNQNRPLGYQQFAAGTINASTALTVPAGAVLAIINCEAQAIRFRDDGTAPTAAVGFPLAVGSLFTLEGRLESYLFIAQVAGAVLNVLYYGAGG